MTQHRDGEERAVESASEAGTTGAGDSSDAADAGHTGHTGHTGDAGGAPQISVGVFEGPLDLLLHLIEREELDVTEVSLLQVTEQYLGYLQRTDQLNLNALADFVSVGARLLLLKSRALLPREHGVDAHDDEDEDDARDLLEALREYRRFKQAAEFLRTRDELPHGAYRREAPPPDVPLPTGLDKVTLDSLVDVIRDVLERMPEEKEQPPEVKIDRVRLRDRIGSIVTRLEREGRTSFRALIASAPSREVVVVDFLAVLELIKARFLEAQQSEAFGDIDLVRREGAGAPTQASLDSAVTELEG